MGTSDLHNQTADALLEITHALESVLEQERAAVSALKVDALPALVSEKALLSERLRETLSRFSKDAGSYRKSLEPVFEDKRRRVRAAAVRVLANAEANRLLLADAVSAMAEVRGMTRSTGTYDARARLGSYQPARTVKAL